MNKLEYIAKQLARTKKKKFELYVITRIVHQLNRDDLEVVTQQYISRPSPENHALVDLYFPQLSLCVEVDEPFHESQVQKDISRETDIIDSTGFSIERIKITNDIHFVNNQIDQLCEKIFSKIIQLEKTGQWKPWEIEAKFAIDYHINMGYLSVQEGSSFRTSVDACNALGQNYKAVQQSWFKLIHYPKYVVWFPKFYENEEWDNAISDDRTTIKMVSKDPLKREKYYFKNLYNNRNYIMAFPRVIDSLGRRLYKFAGIFVFDEESSSIENGNIFKRVETYFRFNHHHNGIATNGIMNNNLQEISESEMENYFEQPSLLIRVNRLYKEGMSEEALYEITRGLWKVGYATREKARLAFTVYYGVIKEVYSINRWYPAMTLAYQTRNPLNDGGNLDGRWEFDGQIAPNEIRDRYINLSVRPLFKRGNSNPIMKVGFD